MYKTCPKCGHRADPASVDSPQCTACGVIYGKWMKQRFSRAELAPKGKGVERVHPLGSIATFVNAVSHTGQNVGPLVFAGRAAGLAGLAVWSTLPGGEPCC